MKRPLLFVLLSGCCAALDAAPWPQFRGPHGDGISDAENVPLTFGEQEFLKWKTDLPGRGWSSPVSDGKTLWVTTAEEIFPDEEEKSRILKQAGEEEKVFASRQVATRIGLSALAIDFESGKITKTVHLAKIENPQTIHTLNSFASPTPVFAGNRLYAHFGAFGTFAIDTEEGGIVWQKRIDLEHGVGPGSSPLLHDGRLFLICDGVDRQFVTALDAATGEPVWSTDRPAMRAATGDQRKSYNTPVLLVGEDGREQLVCLGAQWLVSYEPTTGKELWRLDHGDGFSVVPRPVYSPKTGLLYLSTGYGKPELLAVRVDGTGDITGSDHIAWREAKRIPARPSPILVGDELYVMADGGVASCFDAATGSLHWTERIDGNYSASPLFADGHLFFANHEGVVTVVKPGRSLDLVSRNALDGTIMASPLALEGHLVIRSGTALYCFSK